MSLTTLLQFCHRLGLLPTRSTSNKVGAPRRFRPLSLHSHEHRHPIREAVRRPGSVRASNRLRRRCRRRVKSVLTNTRCMPQSLPRVPLRTPNGCRYVTQGLLAMQRPYTIWTPLCRRVMAAACALVRVGLAGRRGADGRPQSRLFYQRTTGNLPPHVPPVFPLQSFDCVSSNGERSSVGNIILILWGWALFSAHRGRGRTQPTALHVAPSSPYWMREVCPRIGCVRGLRHGNRWAPCVLNKARTGRGRRQPDYAGVLHTACVACKQTAAGAYFCVTRRASA